MGDAYDIIVVGGGPAGLTAAMYASRSGLNTALFEGKNPGGQLNSIPMLENYPGFPEGISGPELAGKLVEQMTKFGAEMLYQNVDRIEKTGDNFTVYSGGVEYTARNVVIATGLSQQLGIPGEEEYLGKGVSYCATCDAPLYRGLDAAVIGGGNYAVEESLKLASFTKKTYIISAAKELNVTDELKEAVAGKENMQVLNSTKLLEIYGENSLVTGIRVINNMTRETKEIKLEGVFIYLGKRVPNTKFVDGLDIRDEKGFIEINGDFMTKIEGLFAIGDVRTKSPHQVSVAVGDAAACAILIKKNMVTKH